MRKFLREGRVRGTDLDEWNGYDRNGAEMGTFFSSSNDGLNEGSRVCMCGGETRLEHTQTITIMDGRAYATRSASI